MENKFNLREKIDSLSGIERKTNRIEYADEIIIKIINSGILDYNLRLYLFKNKFRQNYIETHIQDLNQELILKVLEVKKDTIIEKYESSPLHLINYIMCILQTKIFYREKEGEKPNSYISKINHNSSWFMPTSYDMYTDFDLKNTKKEENIFEQQLKINEMQEQAIKKYEEALEIMPFIILFLNKSEQIPMNIQKQIEEYICKYKVIHQATNYQCYDCVDRMARILYQNWKRGYSEFLFINLEDEAIIDHFKSIDGFSDIIKNVEKQYDKIQKEKRKETKQLEKKKEEAKEETKEIKAPKKRIKRAGNK